ncbi:SepM family pheromone-processing serine protease [Oceanobacillus bengalensis]|uniref:endopeptidase La n=1 Tax=Oceanobacillus bengalensis TaxID=1435466 RepID=A0A494Z1Q2_9BACI|nr:SepM family pheromone-processing serine protease [Oceanobacillus bengalensis]RKQ16397.1 PDZ domain-containing protein [Oceanobacillus bengalensis]
MKFTKRNIIYLIIVIIIAYFLASYQLPYYIQRPGGADALNPIVEVESGFTSGGDMHLVTVSGLQATPVQYAIAKIFPHNEIMPIEDVFPHGITQNEYMEAQLQVMESSQEAATVVAYTAADADITIDYNGVYVVSVVEEMPADGKLQTGDRIITIDGVTIDDANDLIRFVESKQANDTITLEIIRDDETLMKDITLEVFDDLEGKVGIGISLVTDRSVQVSPEVEFSSGNIGGPSAGLMFSLEIYDQLTEEDLTKGYEIAGTGEIDYDGNVHRIGGIDKKIVAADREGIDIFFAPNEDGREDSNYQVAKQTAEEIGTEMEVVPVDTFYDALEYLENLK